MAMRRVVAAAALLACVLLPMAASPVRGRNITAILDGYKEYKLYNKYLSETKVCDEINSRQSTSMTILFDGLFDTPSTTNLTLLLERAGCKVFASLAARSGVLKTYEAAMDKGLTLFAPNDDAFQAKDVPDVKSMSSANLTKLLQYNALPSYNTKTSLKFVKGTLRTLATTKAGVTVVAKGDDVSLDTGKSKSRVADTVVDSVPFCLLTVDSLLVPPELYVGAPEAAPAPAPAEAPQGSPSSDAPSVGADHAADHKTKKPSSSGASRPIGAFAAACSLVLASLLL
ncbi:hypothetical protein PVAP13_9NG770200 [Panicum virgatum]|uniref:FAS1 domain-containing protein n=1 Tax=Panicum virgatum TaxID=38727 RepID=A0A8T0N9X9_PANVG|nr:hypothetical protein PVAP13_9NG770200 [Panicum virgatum]